MDTPFRLPPDPNYPNAKRPTVYQDGLEFQDFVCSALAKHHIILQNNTSRKWQFDVGENLQGFEIKFDDWCSKSGRLSIEIAEKSKDDEALLWTPSGIMRKDNAWLYIQGNYQILFVFMKVWLKNYFATEKPETTDKGGTIRTFYLPITTALKHAKMFKMEI